MTEPHHGPLQRLASKWQVWLYTRAEDIRLGDVSGRGPSVLRAILQRATEVRA